MLDDENNNNYYKTNVVLRFLRFLNLLEPDRNVLSLSKIYMWVMLVILVAVFVMMPDQLDVIIGASAAMVASILNYSYRRWTQLNNIKYDRNEPTDLDDGFVNMTGGGSSKRMQGKNAPIDNPDEER